MPYPYNNSYAQPLSYQQVAQTAHQVGQPMMQPTSQLYQYSGQRVLVDGPAEAMNRFLMRYPAYALTPGFISDELFDVNGRQFYTLSVEADGRRNLETFDFKPHVEERPVTIDGAQFVSRAEFDDFVTKVKAALGATDGLHATVSAVPAAAAAPTSGQPGRVNDAGQDQHAQELGRGQLAGVGGAAVPVQ